ncbi:MAG: restriction endonuclease subunit S [Nodosilinea sp.]
MGFRALPLGWELKTLDDIAQSDYGLVDGPFGSNLPASCYVPSGIPVIRGSNLSLGEVSFKGDDFVYVSEETAKRLARSLCGPEDIVLTKKGTLGQTGFVPENHRYKQFLISSNQMKLSVNRDVADPRFVYYYVSSPMSREKIIRDSEVTGVPKTNLAYLKTFPILLPSLDEQKEIAHILGTLDDKIELNQQMNRTLEGIARALFKSWFIDFDPVRAKLDGRQPYRMDAETAALFPDSFDDSPLGKIPKGWRVGRLDDLIILQRGFDLPKTNRTSGKYPVLAASGPSGTHNEYKVKGPGITTGRSGVLGNIFFVHEDFWPLNTSLWVKEFRESRPIHTYYVLQDLNLEVFNAGSAVPTLNRNHVHGLKVVIPPLPVIEVFESLVMLIFQKKKANDEESIDISAVRDVLLPKLLSGEIRVKDAEQALEAVA